MGHAELLIVGLFVAAVGVGAVARRLSLPYPIAFVLGAALFGSVAGVPQIALTPAAGLVVVLPPLL